MVQFECFGVLCTNGIHIDADIVDVYASWVPTISVIDYTHITMIQKLCVNVDKLRRQMGKNFREIVISHNVLLAVAPATTTVLVQ